MRINLKLGLTIVAEKSSKFSDLLVFTEQSTPKRVHPRNSVCRLCGDAFESRHFVFSVGLEKLVVTKISITI